MEEEQRLAAAVSRGVLWRCARPAEGGSRFNSGRPFPGVSSGGAAGWGRAPAEELANPRPESSWAPRMWGRGPCTCSQSAPLVQPASARPHLVSVSPPATGRREAARPHLSADTILTITFYSFFFFCSPNRLGVGESLSPIPESYKRPDTGLIGRRLPGSDELEPRPLVCRRRVILSGRDRKA
jgi:hypothetical protein